MAGNSIPRSRNVKYHPRVYVFNNVELAHGVVVLQRTCRPRQPTTIISVSENPSTPVGVLAISRGLSEATPPDMRSVIEADPGGVAAPLSVHPEPQRDQAAQVNFFSEIQAFHNSSGSGTPAGVQSHFRFVTGGIVPATPGL